MQIDTRAIVPDQLYARAEAKWGAESQFLMLAEEAAELSAAVIHFLRGGDIDELLEEIADVQIMIEQIKHHFIEHGNKEFCDHLVGIQYQKLIRLRDRLDEK
jgi:NTP pyrophosphatase (non-canonical NTP hydrolase)